MAILLGIVGSAGTAGAAGTGAITGRVTDARGDPIGSLCVSTTNGPGTQTDANGDYAIKELDAGSYTVGFGCGDQRYLQEWYPAATSPDAAQPIQVDDGKVVGGIDATMVAAASFSGSVTDSSGAPLPGICVAATRPRDDGWDWIGGSTTDGAGHYTVNGLTAGEVRVEYQDCNATGHYVTQWWQGRPDFDSANPIVLAAGDARTGIDAALTAGGAVTGTVTSTSGQPLGGICVNAVQGDEGVAFASTAPDGTYTLDSVPTDPVLVDFQDCNATGPYTSQWWDHAADSSAATSVTVATGATVAGIDASLAPASAITGHVQATNGDPLANVCVSALGTATVGGGARTDGNGNYLLALGAPGTYRVQFVDCNHPAAYAGRWWHDQASEDGATPVTVALGQVVGHVDQVLDAGAPGSISGRVTNLAGVGMSTACVVAYVPNQGGFAAPIASDGTYALTGVGAGSYFVGFYDCNNAGLVTDPVTGAATYASVWNPAQPVTGAQSDLGPDPVAAGAVPVVVAPGQARTGVDHCFGCAAITITSLTPGEGQITVAFSAPSLVPPSAGGSSLRASSVRASSVRASSSAPARGVRPLTGLAAVTTSAPARVAAAAAAPPATLTYRAVCSADGGAAGSTTGTGSPLTVTGLTSGKTYSCAVAASDGPTAIASSAVHAAVLVGTATPTSVTNPTALPAAATVAPAATDLARTGPTGTGVLVRLGLLLVGLGAALTVGSRHRARLHRPS